jgi:hypothetical protein
MLKQWDLDLCGSFAEVTQFAFTLYIGGKHDIFSRWLDGFWKSKQ